MSKKRIIEHDTDLTLRSDDYILKDSATNNTKKITPEAFVEGALDNYLAGYVSGLDSTSASSDSDIFYTVVDGVQKKVSKSTLLSADRTARATAEGTIVANFASPYSTTTQYAVGDYCIKDLVLYKCTSPTSGTWDSSKWTQVTALDLTSGVASDLADEIEARQSADEALQGEIDELPVDVKVDGVSVVDTNNVAQINNKANTTGTYDDLVVGTAQNLLSESFTEDKVPYNFRQSFNGARLEDEIVGGTVAWNQIYKYTIDGESLGVRALSQNGVVTISGTTTGAGSGRPLAWADFKSVIGHKYIYLIDFQMPNNSYIMDQYNISTAVNAIGRVFNASFDSLIPQLRFEASGVVFDISNKHLSIIDLTQALGSTIADYLYTIDQANAGAGLAKLQEWGFCTKSYYAYNSGALMSVNTSSHDTVGFNQWDEEWEKGSITDNGFYVNTDTIRSKNFNRVKPNTEYYISNPNGALSSQFRACFFDENKTFISRTPNTVNTFTTPSNCHYFKLTGANAYGATYHNDICVNISDASKNGTYEPYTKHTYPLDSDLTLRGIPKLDSNNNLYYDGDIYKSDGSVTRRFGVVDLGTLTWTIAGSGRHNVTISDGKYASTNAETAKILSSQYRAISADNIASIDMSVCFGVNGNATLQVNDSRYNNESASDFKAHMSGVYLVYELATPTSETADAFINPQIVDARGTEEYVDYAESQGTRDVAIPVGHNSKYYADLKSKIENIPDVPSTNGTYTLKATRSASGVTYAWVSG